MKIMHIITGLGTGGAEVMLYRLLTRQADTPHSASVISLRGSGDIGRQIAALGIPVTAMHMHASGLDPIAMARIVRQVCREKPDIIQTWMYHSDLIGGLVGASLGIPVVWGIHNAHFTPVGRSRTALLARRLCAMASPTVPAAIVSCSEAAKIVHAECGYDDSKIEVIPNGFDLKLFAPDEKARNHVRSSLGIPPDAPVILHAARLNPIKDHRRFILAAEILHSRMPHVHFLMAGEGVVADNPTVRSWLDGKEFGGHMHLLGLRKDMNCLYTAADIMTTTSLTEAFPLVVGEAMASGTPCIVTDVGDSALLVGETGITVPPANPQAILNAWERMLLEGEDGIKNRGRAARERITEHFSLPLVARRYTRLHERVVDSRRDSSASPSVFPAGSANTPAKPAAVNLAFPQRVMPTPAPASLGGGFIVSLDFELMWGMQDILPPDGGGYRPHLLGARTAIPKMLELFAEFGVAATWATVGMLFAESREELEAHFPADEPAYLDPRLSTRKYHYGSSERDDPLHFAPSLIELIRQYPNQEIGTHSFSHYYCLEPGQTGQDFSADLKAAIAIAASKKITLRSIVFPRNQHNPAYDHILAEAGITAFRGNRPFWPDQAVEQARYFHPARRIGRIADVYLPVSRLNSTAWGDVTSSSGPANIPAHRLMVYRQPQLEPRRLERIIHEMRDAAESGRIYHLWWHPHNFGMNQEAKLSALRRVLETYAEYHDRFGMQSFTMADTARIAHRAAVSGQARQMPISLRDEPEFTNWRIS